MQARRKAKQAVRRARDEVKDLHLQSQPRIEGWGSQLGIAWM